MAKRTYRPGEFAAAAGVTIRTLHHYDRVGVLRPRRTAAGHRRYVEADLRAVREIAALKALGVALKDIAALRHADGAAFADRLRAQRHVLEDRLRLTTRLVDQLKRGEERVRSGTGRDLLDDINTIVDEEREQREWQDVARATLRYRLTLPLEAKRQFHREWQALLRDLRPRLDEDPAVPAIQALAARWLTLARRTNPAVPVATLLRLGQSNLKWAERWGTPVSTEWRRSMALLTRAAMLRVNQSM
jgi:DNA-binding transcriptional MerR regulator